MKTHPKPVQFGPFIVLLLCSFLMLMAVSYYLGNALTSPSQTIVSKPTSALPIKEFVIQRDSIAPLKGWIIEGTRPAAVILLHSIRSDRREMLGRAEFLHKAGYSVLMPDLQAHGETAGQRITWGFREARDVQAALDFIHKKRPQQSVGIIGVSLGGAASLLGVTPVKADALVLESVYSDIVRAIENRLVIHLGEPGKWLTPLLSWQIEASLNIPVQQLSPVSAITQLTSPVLIIAGTEDRYTLPDESKEMYAAANGSKQIWLIEGAAHQNFYQYAPREYQQRILSFLDQHLIQSH